ncbi:MAG: hypothetical protein HRU20_20115 [Pseudomonadales bacterium]|nr:hypothetical protein [Pseudomonadales bacterium]
MPLSLLKNAIIAGDKEQFKAIVQRHFMFAESGSDVAPDQTLRIAYGSAFAQMEFNTPNQTSQLIVLALSQHRLPMNRQLNAELGFNLQMVERLFNHSPLDKKIIAIIQPLKGILFSCAILDSDFWTSDHALLKLVNILHAHAMGWQDNYSSHSDDFLKLYQKIVTIGHSLCFDDGTKFEKLLESSELRLNRFKKRFDVLNTRLAHTESGRLHAESVHDELNRFFIRLLDNKQLPVNVAHFIQETLFNELKFIMLKEGIDTSVWSLWKRRLLSLVHYYQPSCIKALNTLQAQRLKTFCEDLNEAAELLWRNEHLPAQGWAKMAYQVFIDQINFDFLKIAAGDTCTGLQPAQFIALNVPSACIKPVSSPYTLDQINKVSVGQWFIFTENNHQVKRCQIVAKLDVVDQLVFSNFIGQKSMTLSFKAFAEQLSYRQVLGLNHRDYCHQIFSELLDELLINVSVGSENEIQHRLKEELHQHQEAMQELKRQEAIMHQAQAKHLLAHQKADEARKKAAMITGELRQQLSHCFDALAPGACIEMLDDSGHEFSQARLSNKVRGINKFTFVDRHGDTVMENHRTQLIDKAVQGKIRLLSQKNRFFQRLPISLPALESAL